MSTGVPVGATITRVYFRVPDYQGHGPESDTEDGAVRHARALLLSRVLRNLTDVAPPVIDEHWVLSGPHGVHDLVVRRTRLSGPFGAGAPTAPTTR